MTSDGEVQTGRLVANLVHFGRLLRGCGLPIGPGKVLSAVEAVRAVGITNREDFYWTLHAVFVNRYAHRELFDWQRPTAGPIAFPGLLRGSVDDFCRSAVREAGVLLLPGSLYGDYNAFRVGFGRKNLPEALARLEEFVAGLRQW